MQVSKATEVSERFFNLIDCIVCFGGVSTERVKTNKNFSFRNTVQIRKKLACIVEHGYNNTTLRNILL